MKYFKLPPLRVHLFGYIFSPGWLPSLATVLLLTLLVGLGCWQLDRAHQKKRIEEDFSRKQTILTIEQITNPLDPLLRYRLLQVTGYFDNKHSIFIDNKVYQHRPGIHVLTPLVIPNQERRILVNRGFMPLTNRQALPVLQEELGVTKIKGFIQFPSRTFLLRKELLRENWPLLVQTINQRDFEKVLHYPVYPFVLMQQNEDKSSLIRDWNPVNIPSYRHMGYAVQWFSLALTLLIIYIKLNTSRVKND